MKKVTVGKDFIGRARYSSISLGTIQLETRRYAQAIKDTSNVLKYQIKEKYNIIKQEMRDQRDDDDYDTEKAERFKEYYERIEQQLEEETENIIGKLNLLRNEAEEEHDKYPNGFTYKDIYKENIEKAEKEFWNGCETLKRFAQKEQLEYIEMFRAEHVLLAKD